MQILQTEACLLFTHWISYINGVGWEGAWRARDAKAQLTELLLCQCSQKQAEFHTIVKVSQTDKVTTVSTANYLSLTPLPKPSLISLVLVMPLHSYPMVCESQNNSALFSWKYSITNNLALAKYFLLVDLREGFTMCILNIRSSLPSFLGWILRSTIISTTHFVPRSLSRKVKVFENQSVLTTMCQICQIKDQHKSWRLLIC